MRTLTIILALVVMAGLLFSLEVGVNGNFYADINSDFSEGSGMDGGSDLVNDGDEENIWDLSVDLIFSAIFSEDLMVKTNIRADKFLINNNYRQGHSYIRWRDHYILERDDRGLGTGVVLSECYLEYTGIPGVSREHFGLMEWRFGNGGIYNSIVSRNYPPSHIVYYQPFGTLSTFNYGNLSMSFAFGIEDPDRMIIGGKVSYGGFSGAFFTDNYTSELYSLWSARYASKMPGYWEGYLRSDGTLIQQDPYKTKFGDSIHLGVEYTGNPFGNLNLYALFAFHNYKDKNREQGQFTGGKLIQFYPEVTVPMFGGLLDLTGGVFFEYWKFTEQDIFDLKSTTMDYTLFSQAMLNLSEGERVGVLFEFVEPHTAGVDSSSTDRDESTDYHYSFLPRFITQLGETVSLETYFRYSLWGPTYDDPDTEYVDNVEYILGTSLRGYF